MFIVLILPKSFLAKINNMFWSLIGLFLEHDENHYEILIDMVHYSPDNVFVPYSELMTSPSNY